MSNPYLNLRCKQSTEHVKPPKIFSGPVKNIAETVLVVKSLEIVMEIWKFDTEVLFLAVECLQSWSNQMCLKEILVVVALCESYLLFMHHTYIQCSCIDHQYNRYFSPRPPLIYTKQNNLAVIQTIKHVNQSDQDIFGISDTWLKISIDDQTIFFMDLTHME